MSCHRWTPSPQLPLKRPNISPTNFSIVNEPANQSYPIVCYSWVLVYKQQSDAFTGEAMVKIVFNWLTQDEGQAEAVAISYAPLPSSVRRSLETPSRK